MSYPKIGDTVAFYNSIKQTMRAAEVVRIHPAGRPMSLEDVLRYYEPTPEYDKCIPSWERPNRWDRVICRRPDGGFVILNKTHFNRASKHFCAEVVEHQQK